MRIQILDEARDDLVNGYAFYEKQSEGLGAYFLDTLFADIDSLRFYGGIHAVQAGYYRHLSKRFPYAIYYTIQENIVRVRAVLDCRRNPAWIRNHIEHPGSLDH